MCVLHRTAIMISLQGTYRGKVLQLGFLLLLRFLPVWTSNDSLSTLNPQLPVGRTLVSASGHFELGIFPYAGYYYLCIRYAAPIQQAVTWVAKRELPLSDNSFLQLTSNGTLQMLDPLNNHDTVWTLPTVGNVSKAQLTDEGNLLVTNTNGTVLWDSFDNCTDTLLPGQYLRRKDINNKLTSWQANGSPATQNGTYSFGWDDNGTLTLSWTTPKDYVQWKGGAYIPAPDVYNAHTISNVDSVHFHPTLGHLYINAKPPNYPADTAILTGGPDQINATTLKRITIDTDGGLRIWQWTVGQTVTTWAPKANWVVSDRPDSRSQCTSFGTCGPYALCTSPLDSLDPVQCVCPDGFVPINQIGNQTGNQTVPTQGCKLVNRNNLGCSNLTNANIVVLHGVDMPWGGDYRPLARNESVNCQEECMKDCYCAGAVYSDTEQMCWMKTGVLYNLGYPTVALHGTNRTAFLKTFKTDVYSNPLELPKSETKTLKVVEIAVPSILGGLIVGGLIFCLCRRDRVRVPGCGHVCGLFFEPRSGYDSPRFPGSPVRHQFPSSDSDLPVTSVSRPSRP